jgi:hypothetical protein
MSRIPMTSPRRCGACDSESSTPTCSSSRRTSTRKARTRGRRRPLSSRWPGPAIDAGADAFLGHGVHRLWPIEVYRGRPILYGLGNFIFGDIQEPLPPWLYESARSPLGAASEDSPPATDADVTAALNARSFGDEVYFETIVAELRFDGHARTTLRLHPIGLGYGRRLTESGIPSIADADAGAAILERVASMSEQFGTVVAIDDGIRVIAAAGRR